MLEVDIFSLPGNIARVDISGEGLCSPSPQTRSKWSAKRQWPLQDICILLMGGESNEMY